jgi:hypothetical protein
MSEPNSDTLSPKRRIRIPRPHVACERCGHAVRPGGLRVHQRSLSCAATWSRKSIGDDYVLFDYDSRTAFYQLTNQWSPRNAPFVKDFVVGYRRPGWGKFGQDIKHTFIYRPYHTILCSPHVSNAEKLICLHRDPHSPEFLAVYALAELTR